LQRKEAIVVLRQLIEQRIVLPSWVSVEKNEHGGFNLKLKIDCDVESLRLFVAERNLAVREEQEYCVIFKPTDVNLIA
jgi:hypothetical protein